MGKRNRTAAPVTSGAGGLPAWPFPKATPDDNGADMVERTPADPLPGEEPRELPPFGDRILVDQVSLYTDPAKNTIERVALEELVESPFNPRTHYDQQALQALAETIRGVGVMQPLLARPTSVDAHLAFNRANPRFEGEHPRLEIVYGHRRFRAARLAGETHVPVIVRELTDAQASQLQAIENVQRKDLDALEEAEGYQHYIHTHKVTKDQLADEVGLSRTHVYARLKLLTLPEEVKDAIRSHEIAIDIGLAIARLHSPKVQAKALASLRSQHHDLEDGGKRSVRSAKRFLREKFTLDLRKALFDTEDAALLEGADACTTCVKRAGNAPEYHEMTVDDESDRYGRYGKEGNPHLCTDPDCFDAKKRAHLAIEAAKLEAKGKAVIAGNKARAIVSAYGEIKGGYIALKDVKALIARKGKKKGKAAEGEEPALPEVATAIVQDPREGKTHEVVKVSDLQAAGVKLKTPSAQRYTKEWYAQENERAAQERAKNAKKAEAERRLNYAVLGAVRQAAAGQPLPAEAVLLVAQVALAGVGYENQEALCAIYGVDSWNALHEQVATMEPAKLTTLLLDCALVQNVHTHLHNMNRRPHTLMWAAKHYGVDVEEIRADLADAPAADPVTKDLLQEFDAGDIDIDDQQQQDEASEPAAA